MLVLLLSIVSMVSANTCELKKSDVPDLDAKSFVGLWHTYYGTPLELSDRFSDYFVEYTQESENVLTAQNTYWDKQLQQQVNYTATVTVDKNILHWDTDYTTWNNRYVVLFYTPGRCILVGGCIKEFHPNSVYWLGCNVGSNVDPDDLVDELNQEGILEKYGFTTKDFRPY